MTDFASQIMTKYADKFYKSADMKPPRSQLASSAGGAGDADGGEFRARGDHLRVVRALRPLDALQNVLGAVLERAVGRGLILEEDGHVAVVGRPAAEVRRGLAPLPEAFVAALLFELQIAVFDVLRAAHEPDDMVARALEVGADVEKVLLHE